MSIVRVSNHLDDLARDAEESSTVPARRLRDVVSDALEDGNRFAKAARLGLGGDAWPASASLTG